MLSTQLTVNNFLLLDDLKIKYLLTIWTRTTLILVKVCINEFGDVNIEDLVQFLLTENFGNVINIDQCVTKLIVFIHKWAP